VDNLDPTSRLMLAVALTRQGKAAEAMQVENAGNALLTLDEQSEQHQRFDALLKSLEPDGSQKHR